MSLKEEYEEIAQALVQARLHPYFMGDVLVCASKKYKTHLGGTSVVVSKYRGSWYLDIWSAHDFVYLVPDRAILEKVVIEFLRQGYENCQIPEGIVQKHGLIKCPVDPETDGLLSPE